jgi:hypothetical protein
MNIRYKLGVFFMIIQIILIVTARFIPERFFCWAPFDEHSHIDINVIINGRELTDNEIEKRYRYVSKGIEPRSINNVFNLITQYESTYGKNDNADVEVNYSVNGHKERKWKFEP